MYRKRHPYGLATVLPNVWEMVALLAFLLTLFVSPLKSKSWLEAEKPTSASGDRAAAEGEGPCPTLERRSLVPHPVVSMVSVGLEGGHDYPTGDPRALAPGRLSSLLALEVVPTGRKTADRSGPPCTHPPDEHRDPVVPKIMSERNNGVVRTGLERRRWCLFAVLGGGGDVGKRKRGWLGRVLGGSYCGRNKNPRYNVTSRSVVRVMSSAASDPLAGHGCGTKFLRHLA